MLYIFQKQHQQKNPEHIFSIKNAIRKSQNLLKCKNIICTAWHCLKKTILFSVRYNQQQRIFVPKKFGCVEILARVVMDDIRLFFVRLRHILS